MKKIFLIILYSLSLFTVNAENISLKIKLGLNKGYEILIVDSKVEKLNFVKPSYIEEISGLEKLKCLRSITFDHTAFIKDFSFLANATTLEEIVISGVKIEHIDFIYSLPNIRSLTLDSCSLSNLQIDMKKNPCLTILDLSYNKILGIPEILNADCIKSPLIIKNNPNIYRISCELNQY